MTAPIRSLVVLPLVVGALAAPTFAAKPAPPPPDYRVVRLNTPSSSPGDAATGQLVSGHVSPVPGPAGYRVVCRRNQTINYWSSGACADSAFGGSSWLDVPVPGASAPDVQDLTEAHTFPLLGWDVSVPADRYCGAADDTLSQSVGTWDVVAGGHVVGDVARSFGPPAPRSYWRVPVAYAWNAAGSVYTPILLPVPSIHGGRATGANAAGLVVGYIIGITASGTDAATRRAVQWQVDFSTATVLSGPTIVGDDSAADEPESLNAAGQSAGRTQDDASTATVGAMISAADAVPLQPLQRDGYGVPVGSNGATDITDAGNIAGYGGVLVSGRRGTSVLGRAALWRGTSATPINLGGTRSSYSSSASALRESGTTTEVVGRNDLDAAGNTYEAVRWRVTSSGGIEVKALQSLVSPDTQTTLRYAEDVSNHGVITCDGSYSTGPGSTASRPCILFPR